MKRSFLACLALTLFSGLFAVSAYAEAEKADPLKKIYFELKVGMTFSEVRDLVEKHRPNLKLEDTDIWNDHMETSPGRPQFFWVLGVDGKPIFVVNNGTEVAARLHRIVLRVDFDNGMRLMNAVYHRVDKRDFKKIKSRSTNFVMKSEERLALIGDGYYNR